MLAPLSWLKEYIDISLKPKELADKIAEAGLGVEKIESAGDDTIFDLEITPNRPDWLSMMGVVREIAALENKKAKPPVLKTDLKPKNKTLSIKIHPNFSASARMTGIIIDGVKVKESPDWLKKKLELIGQRPINNIVDITNFVMKELGNPIHSFDYHKIKSAEMWVELAKGGEHFESVDSVSYKLPKNAIIYKDSEKIFDLAGIKGGKNSGTYEDTTAVFILVPVDDPVLIRRASQALALRSDASAIFERAVNKGGTIEALKRTVDLVLEIAGGEIASELIDLKKEEFEPWKLSVRMERTNKLLGIQIPQSKAVSILDSLGLSPKAKGDVIECTIPTYRNDLKIEEDLIEEIARIYGYSNFPKTIPTGAIRTEPIPYFKDYKLDEKIKQIFKAAGFSEIYTYTLIDDKLLAEFGISTEEILRVDNPISRDYEYLRPTLRPGMVKAFRENKGVSKKISLFELGRAYTGKSIDKAEETLTLAGITNEKNYLEVKGIIERLLKETNSATTYEINIVDEGVLFEINISNLIEQRKSEKLFQALPKYPSVKEDITLTFEKEIKLGNVLEGIKKSDSLIAIVQFTGQHKNNYTFHIEYLHPEKNLTTEDVVKVREKILQSLQKSFGAKISE